MEFLEFLASYAGWTPEQRSAHMATLTVDELRDLEAQARTNAAPIRDKSADAVTEQDIRTLEGLRDIVRDARTERDARKTRANSHASLSAELEPEDEEAAEETPEDEPADEPEPEAAVTAAPRVASVARRTKQTPAPPVKPAVDFAAMVHASPDAGAVEFTSWFDVAKAAERRMATYGVSPGRHGVAVIKRDFVDDLKSKGDDDEKLVQYATNEKRLPGGGLVAAAGWCAPSQTIYDLCELETGEGMIDIPEVQITRGGLRFTPGPDFATIFGGAGYFHQTEAQVIANTTKPCMEIPCPAFTDTRLEVEGLCITGSILQRRGYPELVERFIRGALVAHMHKLNQFIIAQMVAGSTVVDLNPPVDVPLDVTATSGLLAAVEMTVEDIRYRNRMSFNQTVEIVLPHWATAVMRSDLSRRMGVELLNVSDATIASYFTTRGARLQYVYDWQDSFAGLATGPGGPTPLTAWPNSVFFLAYPAGTWLRGSDDTIRLDTIYDSTNLATNRYTALFTEEGVLVAQVCNGGSRVVEVQFCPNGATSSTVAFVCA